MKQRSKMLLSILLSLVMVLGLLPGMSLTALADGDAYETVIIAEDASASLDGANTSRNLAVGQDGVIHIVYRSGDNRIFYRKSTNSGSNFSEPEFVATGEECEVAVSSTGRVFVAYVNNFNLHIAYSDNGTSFTSVSLEGATSYSLHIAVDGSHVYAIPRNGTDFFFSSDGGQSYKSHSGWAQYAYSDVHIDESNHNVVILKDKPEVVCRYSRDYGKNFSDERPVKCGENQINVHYSTAAVGKGYAYMAGNEASYSSTDYLYKIDYINATATGTPISACDKYASNGRSLSADQNDNVIVGYVSSNGKAYYQVSLNGGETVGSGVEFADASAANAAINTKTGDVLFLYKSKSDGKIMLYKAAGVVPGDLTYTVTFKVVNGTWSDGSTTDKKETVADGSKPASVPTGMKASEGFTGGAWDTNPADATITGATTFTYTFTAKQAATVTKDPTAKTLTYTGQAQELITAGEAEGGTMYYAVTTENTAPEDNLYTTSIPTAINAGTYYVWYMAKGDDNHTDSSAAGPVKVTIAEAAGTYSLKSVQGAEHTLGEDKDAVYTITNSADDNRAFERFTQVSVDGTVVASDYYTTAKGSLVLTLKSAYLNTLTVGEHTVKIFFTDGEMTTSLKILEPTPTPTPKPVPKTGDASVPFLWLALILTGILGIGTLTAVKRRK